MHSGGFACKVSVQLFGRHLYIEFDFNCLYSLFQLKVDGIYFMGSGGKQFISQKSICFIYFQV